MSGTDIITLLCGDNSSAGNDTLVGGTGNDTFNIYSGTDIITLLCGDNSGAGGDSDVLEVSSGATVNAANINSFTATTTSSNAGTANLSTKAAGGTINMAASNSGPYNINGGAGADILTGGSGNDVFSVSTTTEAYGDTINGGAGNDIINLSTGTHTLNNDARLSNVETIVANSSGSTLILTNQAE
jgi:Hemolysin-type calcium-binding repeat (2 copies).